MRKFARVVRHSLFAILLTAVTSSQAGAQALPAPWTASDIGSPTLSGSTAYNSGAFETDAGGSGLGGGTWAGPTDQIHFVWQKVTGDVDVVVRVDTLVSRGVWTEAGVMIRGSLAANAAHAMAEVTAGRGVQFARRVSDGSGTAYTAGPAQTAPVWLRAARTGTRVTAYTSTDGTTWTTLGSASIALGSTAYVGLAVSSHNPDYRTTARLSNLRLTQSGLPSTQRAIDIGSPAIAGSTAYSNGIYTILGAGTDIWDAADQFHFVYQPITGNTEVVARVASVTHADDWSKVGVMVRESLTAASRHASVFVSAARGYAFQRRQETGAYSVHTSGGSGTAPGWVRLVRTGDLFESFRSTDGTTWTRIGSDTIEMGSTVYVGLAVTSHNASMVTTALIDNVRVTSTTAGNQPPAVSLTTPANGTHVTAPATLTITASATDPENRMASVDFYAGSTLITRDTTSPYSVTWSATTPGTFPLTAVAHDADGGSTTSAAVSVTVSSPNGAPTVTLTSPTNGASFTAPAAISMTATASDPENQLARVEFYSGTTLLATDTSAPYSWDWTDVDPGTYTLSASAYDSAGNRSNSSTVTVTVNSRNGAPTVTLTSPTNGASFTAPAAISMTANASDPQNQLVRVEFYRGTTLLATDTTAPYAWNWTNVAAGTYMLSASAYDSAGNRTNSSTVTVTVNAPNGAPTVTLTSPTNGASFAAPASISMTANASDPENQLARVEFYRGTTLLGSDTSAPYAYSWTNVGSGSYTLTAVAVDAAGNRTTSAAATVTVTTSTSTAPRLVVFTASSDHATNVTSYRFDVFTSTANPSTATPVATANLGKPTPAANNDITSDQSTLFSNLAPGNYIATVTAIGPGGSTRSATVSFTR